MEKLPLRILLLNYESAPFGGGAGFASYNIGRELARMGVQADFLTARVGDMPSYEEVDGLRIHRVRSFRKSLHDCGLRGAYSYLAFALPKRQQLLATTAYDLEHYFFSMPTGIMTLAPAWNAPPYIVSLRGSDVPGYDPFNRKVENLHRVLLPVTRRIWSKAKSVVALSHGLEDIALRTMPDMPFEVIPNGIDIDRFSPADDESAREPGSPLRLIAVCRLLERKGLQHLMEALVRPEPLDATLRIVGTGSYEAELRACATQLGLDDRVTFEGFVDNDDLPSLYRQSDVFTLPSQTESFGLVFAEAMGCGLPVLATTVGGIPELVRHETDGLLVEPADPAAIHRSLRRLIDNPDERLAMAASARRRIVENYSWSVVARRYLAVYERAIGRGEQAA